MVKQLVSLVNTNKCSVLHGGEKTTDFDYFMSIGELIIK